MVKFSLTQFVPCPHLITAGSCSNTQMNKLKKMNECSLTVVEHQVKTSVENENIKNGTGPQSTTIQLMQCCEARGTSTV